MYESYFSLKEKPFTVTSDPSFLFLSAQHKEALSSLRYGIRERMGFIAITGEVGTGKTTLCRALLNELDSDTKSAFIFNTDLSDLSLMQALVEDLGIEIQKKNKPALFSALNHFLIRQMVERRNVVLIIDEAQNLKARLLEQIRMLSNLEAENKKLIQIVLVGQPELRDKLNDPSLRQLRQRIAVRCHLKPLSALEISQYIGHRLRVAGANGAGPVFEPAAIDEIYAYSEGIPRVINLVCDKALLMGYAREQKTITPAMIEQCVAEIEGEPVYEHHQRSVKKSI
jgi:general secretion pathway protein A